MSEVTATNLPFAQAIRFFRDKINIPTERWDGVWRDGHDVGFMVAGAAKADLLSDLKQAVDQAISQGTTLTEFRKSFDELVARHGWTYKGGRDWRTRIIFETNIRVAYQAGRWQQMTNPEAVRLRPFWEYRHGDSVHPRPLHLAWSGLVLAWDDDWWKTHYPPNGWGCKCRVFSLSRRDLEKSGRKSPDKAPDDGMTEWVDRKGKTHKVPAGIDPGWDYTPGRSTLAARMRKTLAEKIDALPEPLAKEVKGIIRPDILSPTTREEAKKLGGEILDRILAKRSESRPGKDLRFAVQDVGLIDEKSVLAAKEFQKALLDDLSATRPISTPAQTVQKNGKGRDAIVRASTRFPDDWTAKSDAAGALDVKYSIKRGWYETFADGRGKITTSSHSTAEHEFAHRLQAVIPKLDQFFQEEHKDRTYGDPLEKLADLDPLRGYGRNEKTRKDKYVDAYQGKEYSGKPLEVMSMVYEALLGRMETLAEDKHTVKRLIDMIHKDQEMVRLAIGLLFHWRVP
ncbi:MAG: hypothetical protein HQM01_15300 [Magnetococcales bacterium]|nr:hypothetical protein [Magnetococcales bacterium]